ncbi:hypothetical protein WICPIJ_000507 [Wickerhamomyces pijperi]|uniref:Defect at low temperature protein 1 n=1 Tax=Wickerhamomyces pijperi TaxID=599730 RepID=A0A9P8QCG6_WICPI|nr:hypothetical protein WICPIJ_000507 [Wickerhamomyces pijperi]
MTDHWYNNIHQSSIFQIWSYRTSFIIVLIIFLAFCAIIPIDSILQVSKSSTNLALNTFVVIGALVLFGVFTAFLMSTRIYMERSSLQDIPKKYIPLEPGDLPNKSLQIIDSNLKDCYTVVNTINAKAVLNVKHPGLSAPDSKYLPPLLSFEDVIKALTLKFKWDDAFFPDLDIPKNLSFREIVGYLETQLVSTNSALNREFVDLYEELRYSGRPVTEEEFIRFMILSIQFMKSPRIKGSSGYNSSDTCDEKFGNSGQCSGSQILSSASSTEGPSGSFTERRR